MRRSPALLLASLLLACGGAPETPRPSDRAAAPIPWDRVEPPFTGPPTLPADADAPLVLVVDDARPWSRHLSEVLKAEGWTGHRIVTADAVDAASASVLVVGDVEATPSLVAAVDAHLAAGGTVLAVRPTGELASRFGLQATGEAEDVRWSPRGADFALQTHAPGTLYSLDGAEELAALVVDGARVGPALTSKAGPGRALAIAFDPARAVARVRQGNPAWAGQDRDGFYRVRSVDLFFGGAGRPDGAGDEDADDWIDWDVATVPQADAIGRLLTGALLDPSAAALPLPRVDYLPWGHASAVLMTGDGHANGGTVGRWERYQALSPEGCRVARWECLRGSSFVYPGAPIPADRATAFTKAGFELGLHVDTDGNVDAAGFTAKQDAQMAAWRAQWPDLPPPASTRNHAVVWSGYTTLPKLASAGPTRLDTNYYHWPPSWVSGRDGFIAGTALPMRFADADGRTIDAVQMPTLWTDEAGQVFPAQAEAMLESAEARGFRGVFTANMHTDNADWPDDVAIIEAARARGLPVISGRQLLAWFDARERVRFGDVAWDGSALSFSVRDAAPGTWLQLPGQVGDRALSQVECDGEARSLTPSLDRAGRSVRFAAGARCTARWGTEREAMALEPGRFGPVVSEPPLPPPLGSLGGPSVDFRSTDLTGWSTRAWGRGGSLRASRGAARIDRARLKSVEPLPPGSRLEFWATFGTDPYESVGFADTMDGEPVVLFTTHDDGRLRALSSREGRTTSAETLLRVGPGPHHFAVDWTAESAIFYVDGAVVARHEGDAPTSPRHVVASDWSLGGPLLTLWSLSAGSMVAR